MAITARVRVRVVKNTCTCTCTHDILHVPKGITCTVVVQHTTKTISFFIPKKLRANLETLGLSMDPNDDDDILVQTTSLQTIARVKRVKCFMLHKVP